MITLDNFEDFVPYKIWMCGEEYYETDAVSELEEISPGEWTATVEGTDDYNVEISMDGNEIESWLPPSERRILRRQRAYQ